MGIFKEFSFGQKKMKTEVKWEEKYEKNTVYSPVKGEVIPLSEVPDEVFASKVLGDGIAVYPSEGKLYAPVNGKITALLPTNHAVGITSEDGLELLLHIGIDTVSMKGDGFKVHVNNNDTVKTGQLLVEFDIEKIKEVGLNPCVLVIITNCEGLGILAAEQVTDVEYTQKILSISN